MQSKQPTLEQKIELKNIIENLLRLTNTGRLIKMSEEEVELKSKETESLKSELLTKMRVYGIYTINHGSYLIFSHGNKLEIRRIGNVIIL